MWKYSEQPSKWLPFICILVLMKCQQIDGADYCQGELFDARCSDDEVILMTSAYYGRMQISRCVHRDFGYIGCATDVLRRMHGLCSNKHTCSMSIDIMTNDTLLHSNCHEDLPSYLSATYICLKVAVPDEVVSDVDCPEGTTITAEQPGYISSLVSQETGAGRKQCPWHITVAKGQTLNITLLDFSSTTECVMHVDIISETYSTLLGTCYENHSQDASTYMSPSNNVDIEIISFSSQNSNFLISYSPQGCPDFEPPVNGWFLRSEDSGVIGCNATNERAYLVCEGNTWIGVLINCDMEEETNTEEPDTPPDVTDMSVTAQLVQTVSDLTASVMALEQANGKLAASLTELKEMLESFSRM